jgi:hypothetical protein
VTATFVVLTLLHTRAPTGKLPGPVAGLLLSRPTTFQEIGAMVNVTAAFAAIGTSSARKTTAADASLEGIRFMDEPLDCWKRNVKPHEHPRDSRRLE